MDGKPEELGVRNPGGVGVVVDLKGPFTCHTQINNNALISGVKPVTF